MSKNVNLTHLDPNQIVTLEHDDQFDAKRVILVGGEKLDISIDQDRLVNAIKDGLSLIKFENVQNSQPMIDIPTIIQTPQIEYRTIEVPTIIKEIEYRTIEVPVITERIVTIEKPIIIKEIEFKELIKERHYPKVMQICAIVQAIGVIALLIINLLKK